MLDSGFKPWGAGVFELAWSLWVADGLEIATHAWCVSSMQRFWQAQVVGLHQQHSFQVCLLSSGCQLSKGAVQHTPDIFWEVGVWGYVTPPQVIQKLQAGRQVGSQQHKLACNDTRHFLMALSHHAADER